MWTSFIGFMASGKSTVARRLQAVTNRPAVFLDQVLAEAAGMAVSDIFATQGEPAFRRMEAEAVAGLDAERPIVVDTGGGIVQTPAAVRQLRQNGVIIWLDAPWTTIRSRLRASDTGQRPLVGQLGWAGLEELFRQRRRLYARAADFRLRSDRGSADEIAQRAMLRSLQWERRPQEERR